MQTKSISWIAATTIWLINPVFSGCDSSSEPEFEFGEADLLDLLDDLNAQTWQTTVDGELSTLTVDFSQLTGEEQAALFSALELGSAHACSSRNFLAEAEACIDVSSLPIEGTISISSDLADEAEPQVFTVSGSIDVYGTVLNNAEIWVNSDDIQVNWTGQFDAETESVDFILGYVE